MRRVKRLIPGHDFKDDLSVVPRYSTPSTELMRHDELLGELPEILDPRSTIGLGLSGPWLYDEQCSYSPPTPPPEPASVMQLAPRAKSYFSAQDFDCSSVLTEPEYQIYIKPKWTERFKGKMRKIKPKQRPIEPVPELEPEPQIPQSALESVHLIRVVAQKSKLLKPLDALGDLYPSLLGAVLIAETVLVAFALYEVYAIVNGIIQTVKALLLPLLLVAKLFNIQ